MNPGDPISESDFEMAALYPPDSNQNAWNFGDHLLNDFYGPNGTFCAEVNNNGELITSSFQSQNNGQAGSGSGMDTAGGSDSVQQQQQQQQQQIHHGIDFLPTFSAGEVLVAVVSTNSQSSMSVFPHPTLLHFTSASPSVVVSNTELPATEKAEISKFSSSLAQSDFGGEYDSDVAMEDSSPPPFVRATSPLVVGREGAQTLPYGTDGTAARTPHSAQQPLPHVPMTFSNAPAQALGTTPNMAATAAFYDGSPYYRGRHTQSTPGAESLRRDMEQPNILSASTAAIPFLGLKTQDTTSPAQETAEDDESAITSAKITKKRKSTRKPRVATEATPSPAQETTKEEESASTPATVTKERKYTRKTEVKTEIATASMQETAADDDDDEETITLAKMGSKRANTRKAKLVTKATTSSAQEIAELSDLSNITLAVPKKRTATSKSDPTTAPSVQEKPASTPAKVTKARKPKAPIETQMFAVTTTSDNGTTTEKLAMGSELGLTSPPKVAARSHKRKVPAEPVQQDVRSHKRKAPVEPVEQGVAEANKRGKPHKNYCSGREVRLLTGVEVKEDKEEDCNKRKTRSSVKADGETSEGPNAGKAVRQRREAKK
jgi:hypothetical protein